MNLKEWVEREGVHRVIAYRWFREGKLAVHARKVGRPILVDRAALEPAAVNVDTAVVYVSARLYGGRAATNRARRAVEAATAGHDPA